MKRIMQTSHNREGYNITGIYNQMMIGIKEAFNDVGSEEVSLQKAISEASERMIREGLVSVTTAEEVSKCIKHDINEAAEYMMESSEEFCDWLMLDIDVVERKVVDMFLSVADKTRWEIDNLIHTDQT